jgi:hypothetical protein
MEATHKICGHTFQFLNLRADDSYSGYCICKLCFARGEYWVRKEVLLEQVRDLGGYKSMILRDPKTNIIWHIILCYLDAM